MRREDLLWDGYRLIQDDRFFKLGQDSILLSAFAAPQPRAQVVDLGCGNGALGVLLCARFPNLRVTGLEIQPEVAALAQENVRLNALSDRMEVRCMDMKTVKQHFPTGAFAYVICNPPYFSAGSGYSSPNAARKTAREEQACTLEDAVRAAAYLVKFGGRAAFVHRPERLCDSIAALRACGLEPKRLRMVHQTPTKAPSAVLLEARRGSSPHVSIEPPFFVQNNDGTYTDEYLTVYHKR